MARTSRHLVVDGSNIATEGRTLPSLAQLDEAVRAVQAEDPDRQITVIVDATFAHRIDDSERKAFEDASDNGEILTPPAGAVGRGDAFILQVAEKADAAVLSNDSFQEFHGDHPWLFDEDRLIGGKPVEGVGWIFVARVPVRGPASRRATREAGKGSGRSRSGRGGSKKASGRSQASTEAKGPPPVPTTKTPPPGRRGRGRGRATSDASGGDDQTIGASTDAGTANRRGANKRGANKRGGAKGGDDKGDAGKKDAGKSGRGGGERTSRSRNLEELNSPADFLRFVTQWSIGDEVEAIVERYSSHGCYVGAAGAQCYLPSSAMGDPPPTRARDVVSIGQTAIVKVESLDSDRRGINVELVRVVEDDDSEQQTPPKGRSRRRANTRTSQRSATVADVSAGEANPTRSDTTVATKKSAKKATKKATKKAAKKSTRKAPAKATTSARAAKATARKSAKKAAKKSTRKAPAKKAVKKTAKKTTKKAPAKKATKKATAKKATKKTASKSTAKRATRKAPAKKATKKTAKKTTKKAPAKKATAKKTTRKTASKSTAKRATKKA